MPEVYTPDGKVIDLPADQVAQAFIDRHIALPQDRPVPVVSPDGEAGYIDPENAAEAFKAGYRFDPAAVQTAEEEVEYGTPTQQAIAGIEGVASGLTFGASRLAQKELLGTSAADMAARARVNPGISIGGEVGGAVLPTILSFGTTAPASATALTIRGASLLGRGLKAAGAPVRAVSRAGLGVERAAARVLPKGETALGQAFSKAAARTAGTAAEGTAYAAGSLVNEAAMHEDGNAPLTAEHAMAVLGLGTVLGGAAGGLSSLLGSSVVAAVPKVRPSWLPKGVAPEKLEEFAAERTAKGLLSQAGPKAKWARQVDKYHGGPEAFGESLQEMGIGRLGMTMPDNLAVATQHADDAGGAIKSAYAQLDAEAFASGAVARRSLAAVTREAEAAIPVPVAPVKPKPPAGKLFGWQVEHAHAESRYDDALKAYNQAVEERPAAVAQMIDSLTAGEMPMLKPKHFFDRVRKTITDPMERDPTSDAIRRKLSRLLSRYSEGEQLTFSRLWEIRKQIDGSINWSAPELKAYNKAAARLRNEIQSQTLELAEKTVPGMADEIGNLNRRYATARTAKDIAADKIAATEANRTFSLTDHIAGLGGMSVGAMTSNPFGWIIGGPALMGMNWAMRKHGNQALAAGATALANIQRKMTANNSRIQAAVKRMITGVQRVTQRTKAPIAVKLALKPGETRLEAFNRTWGELQELQLQPTQFITRLEEAYAPMAEFAPDTAMALQAKAVEAVGYLAQTAPRNPRGEEAGILARPWEPTERQIGEWERRVAAVNDPIAVLEEAAAGKFNKEGVETVKAIYPELFEKAKSAAVTAMVEAEEKGERMDYRTRLQVSRLFSVRLGPSLQPGFVAQMQQIHAADVQEQVATAEQQQQPARASSSVKGARESNVAESYATSGDRLQTM